MPVEVLTVAVFRRATVVSVPFTMLKVAVLLVVMPTWLSCGVPLTLVVVKVGALEPEPKLNVPPRMSRFQALVIGAEAALSIRVQFALVSVISRLLVPVPVLKRRFVRMPFPASVLLVKPLKLLVQPPPMISLAFAVPPLNVVLFAPEVIGITSV